MTKIRYIEKTFRPHTLELLRQANAVVRDYQAQGFSLTLRQLYYQLVARGLIPNTQAMYKRLGNSIADGRNAGLIDWEAIEDRTRELRTNAHWSAPGDILRAALDSYRIDRWSNQPQRPEIWVEKDAIVGVIAGVCEELDVSYFSCRGYTSASEIWRAGLRARRFRRAGQDPIVLHFGDHDPSGIDMTRDIAERLELYAEEPVTVDRIALNMDQIDLYNPPPNPAKLTDSRANGYFVTYGYDSWELDALEPAVIVELIRDNVLLLRDEDLWREASTVEDTHREMLGTVIDSVGDVDPWLG